MWPLVGFLCRVYQYADLRAFIVRAKGVIYTIDTVCYDHNDKVIMDGVAKCMMR